MDFLLFTVAEKILANYPKDPLDNPLRQTLRSCLKTKIPVSLLRLAGTPTAASAVAGVL